MQFADSTLPWLLRFEAKGWDSQNFLYKILKILGKFLDDFMKQLFIDNSVLWRVKKIRSWSFSKFKQNRDVINDQLLLFTTLTVIITDDATLCAVHVGGGHEGDVAQLEDGPDEAEDVVNLVCTQAEVLHRFLQRKYQN